MAMSGGFFSLFVAVDRNSWNWILGFIADGNLSKMITLRHVTPTLKSIRCRLNIGPIERTCGAIQLKLVQLQASLFVLPFKISQLPFLFSKKLRQLLSSTTTSGRVMTRCHVPPKDIMLLQIDPKLSEFSGMMKQKLKLPEKAKRVFPDRLGSWVGRMEDKDGGVGEVNSICVFGKELETFQPNGFESEKGSEGKGESVVECECECEAVVKARTVRHEKEGRSAVRVDDVLAADEKRSDLEFELSQKEINLEKLQRIASTGLPDGGGLRATTWKLLLGYLSPTHDLWEKELAENRSKYSLLKEETLRSPSVLTMKKNEELDPCDMKPVDLNANIAGPLRRHEVSQDEHPLNLGTSSVWHQYFQYTEIEEQIDRDLQRTHPDLKFFSGETSLSRRNRESMRNILLLFAKLNPAIRYVQGMNEVLAPLLFVFSTDTDEQNAANAEADSFACFVRLLSDSVDHFCQQLDNSPVGIHSTLARLSDLLRANDEELWRHLEYTTKVNPQFYAFRWITLLLTQEFDFQSILRIWDSLLSNPFGIQDMLLRICCAMLLCVKSRLLNGDFIANLKLLQHYPDVNLEHLLEVARDLTPDTSNFRLSI